MHLKYCMTILLFLCTTFVNSKRKGSLTFAIDATWSMTDEIDGVKKRTSEVFDAVLKSHSSIIEDFVIVTFRDPDVETIIVTKNAQHFKKELKDITLIGNEDCPEYSMTGIESAINASRPNSFIYVFTDAAAKDYEKYESVKAQALAKSTQVTFLLTGLCGDCVNCTNYLVYHKLAKATGGEVFNIEKHDIPSIMDYIINVVKTQKCSISHQHFPGLESTSQTFYHSFIVDGGMEELTLSLAGQGAQLQVYDDSDTLVESQTLVKLEKSHILKITNMIPGKYTASITVSEGEATLDIKGECTFSFEHGFSKKPPTGLQATSKSPYLGQNTFLAVKVDDNNDEVKLKSVQLKDLDNNILMELKLNTVHGQDDFYVTDEFLPPDSGFKIAVKGIVTRTNEEIIRNAIVSVETLKSNFAPKILETKFEITDKIIRVIECSVKGYPKPVILWKDEFGNSLGPGYVTELSVATFKSEIAFHIHEDVKVKCTAHNDYGNDTASFELTSPEIDKSKTEYITKISDNVDLSCRITEGIPKPNITWSYIGKNGDERTLPSSEEILHLTDVDLDDAGVYVCHAANDMGEDTLHIDLAVQFPPYIEPRETSVIAYNNQNVVLDCVAHGLPVPSVQWFVNETKVIDGKNYHIHKNNSLSFLATFNDKGTYKCEVTNELGTNSSTYNVSVYSLAPIITLHVLEETVDDQYTIQCLVDGYKPEIIWRDQLGNELKNNVKTSRIGMIYNSTIQVKNTHEEYITCSAKNEFGKAYSNYNYPAKKPEIDSKITKSIEKMINQSVDLFCKLKKGIPKPKIEWYTLRTGRRIKLNNTDEILHIENLQLTDAGRYYCVAYNPKGKDVLTVKLHVYIPPQILSKGDLVVSEIGKKMTLDCVVTGFPSPSVIWYFRDNEIVSGGIYNFHSNHSISFRTDSFTEGSYQCVAQYKNHNVSITYEMKPYLKTPISIKPPQQTMFNLSEGDSQSLDCEAVGIP